jgi:uncharacterized protein YbaR (Trm112 family)
MPLNPELLRLLACPQCKGPLAEEEDNWLLCDSCRVRYPLRDGIPVMLLDEAEPY